MGECFPPFVSRNLEKSNGVHRVMPSWRPGTSAIQRVSSLFDTLYMSYSRGHSSLEQLTASACLHERVKRRRVVRRQSPCLCTGSLCSSFGYAQGFGNALRMGTDAEGAGLAHARPTPYHRGAADARSRLSQEGLHCAEALASQRTDHLYSSRRTEVLDRRRRRPG